MKLLSLALVASAALGCYAIAQTPPAAAPAAPAAAKPPAAPAAAAPAAAKPYSTSGLSHDCKKEVDKYCGRHAGSELNSCIKSTLDMKQFSATCTTEFQNQAAGKKPQS